jgi:phosphatidylinositol-3-phosphatase
VSLTVAGPAARRTACALVDATLALCVLVVATHARAARPRVPVFRHVLVVVLENKERAEIVGNPAAPTFNALARRYATLSNYDAVAHPSLPNYLALVSGSTHGIHSDCTSCVVHAPSLADTLERAGLTWKTYAQGLPYPGFDGAWNGAYAKKHDPFLYFSDVASSARRRANIVPLRRLRGDAVAGRLPSFALVVPDQCHDMHSCPIATGDRWLRENVVPLLHLRSLARSVVFVVFDEGTTALGGGGHVAALALGPRVRPHSTSAGATSHYGLLRTIETAWSLPHLGLSADTPPIEGIWR